MKTLLHVGCGPEDKSDIKGFDNDDWKEIRLDIDEDVNPDIVETATVDAVYSAYNIDHIYAHEVPIALGEFYRVLKDDGLVIVKCPDLQSVAESVAQDKLLDTLYVSPIGPISAIDIMYGNRKEISDGNTYMEKKVGFTYTSLDGSFFEAGFKTRYGGRSQNAWELMLVAFKQKKSEEEITKIANPFF